jgi:hypothetical protein
LIGRRKLVLGVAVGLTAAVAVPFVAAAAPSSNVAVERAVRPQVVRRYVALGDSVPYGYGLANPGTGPHSGLGADQPPSSEAYPSVLAKSLGLTISIRKDGCTIGGDQLAVSGAPSVVANINGPDVECHSSRPHKTVDPTELGHLGTAAATLVTVQVGADDIDFGGCLMHEINIDVPYSIYGQTPRKCTSGTGLTGAESNRLKTMRIALGQILTSVRKQQPKATIVVLNYYQPIPSPSEFVNIDRSEICARLAVPGLLDGVYAHAVIVQDALNQAIATEMELHSHDHLVNLALGSVFAGHAMCTRKPYLFTGGPKVGLWRFGYPNAAGQVAIADAIRLQVPGLR